MKEEKKKDREGEYDPVLGIWIDNDGTGRIPMNGFPIDLFLEWNRHCVTRHKNCRWEKVYSDHEKARAYEIMVKQMTDDIIPAIIENKQEEVYNDTPVETGNKEVKLMR